MLNWKSYVFNIHCIIHIPTSTSQKWESFGVINSVEIFVHKWHTFIILDTYIAELLKTLGTESFQAKFYAAMISSQHFLAYAICCLSFLTMTPENTCKIPCLSENLTCFLDTALEWMLHQNFNPFELTLPKGGMLRNSWGEGLIRRNGKHTQ